MPALDPDAILAVVRERCPDAALERSENGMPWLRLPAEGFAEVAAFLRDDARLRLDSLMCLSGVDLSRFDLPPAKPLPPPKAGAPPPKPPPPPPITEPSLACVYFLHSLVHRHKLTVKVFARRDGGSIPSVSAVWGVAGYFEREVYDLLGIAFPGHGDLRRIMCPDDWEGHPLRKDYVYPVDYHGIALRRAGQHFEDGPYA